MCTIFDEVTPTLLKETREVIEQILTDLAAAVTKDGELLIVMQHQNMPVR